MQSTLNTMSLIWGIQPKLVEFVEHTDQMTSQVDRVLFEQGLVEVDDLVVIAAGSPPGQAGSTNSIKVHRVGDITDAGQLPDSHTSYIKEGVGPWPTKKK
ncbi:hypothetical protein MN0502_15730 [Arthrobacter sp. MN05-02]|nr:hypothetical protein MN0502_15730 [Arthrobacter sp. MN05-02]